MATAKITKLEAVNRLLDAIGEDAVNSLESGLADAEQAERKIIEVSKELQAKGWDCNTSFGLMLQTDDQGRIPLPDNTLKVDTTEDDERMHVGTRGGFLFDLDKNTLVFPRAICVDLVQFLEFEDLPYELQNYIVCRAGRIFQENAMGSTSLDGFTARREKEAEANWTAAASDTEDANIIDQSSSVRVITFRRNRIRGA
jgi:hypothetical protein